MQALDQSDGHFGRQVPDFYQMLDLPRSSSRQAALRSIARLERNLQAGGLRGWLMSIAGVNVTILQAARSIFADEERRCEYDAALTSQDRPSHLAPPFW